MATVARRWNRRVRKGSAKDNEVDEGIWDRNDSAFFEEVARSRTNSGASASEAQEALRTSFQLVPTAQRSTNPPSYPPSTRTSTSVSLHPAYTQSQDQIVPVLPNPVPPIKSTNPAPITGSNPLSKLTEGSLSVQDLRRPSISSAHMPLAPITYTSGTTTPARNVGVIASIKRIVSRRGSKKSDHNHSTQTSPTVPPIGRPSLTFTHTADVHLPPAAIPSPILPSHIARSPEELLEASISRGLATAFSNATTLPLIQPEGTSRERQLSALNLPLPPLSAALPLSPHSGFAAWEARGSFSDASPIPPAQRGDLSPTRKDSGSFGAPAGWTLASPPPPPFRRRASSHRHSQPPPASGIPAEDGSVWGRGGPGQEAGPLRPRRSVDVQLQNRATSQSLMDAFNHAHTKRWSGARSPTGSALEPSRPRKSSSRRKSDASAASLASPLTATSTLPSPAILSPHDHQHLVTIANSSPLYRPVSAQENLQSPGILSASTTSIDSVPSRRRSFTPFDTKRLSGMLPTVHASPSKSSSPITPGSISRPLSVCSSTFDTASNGVAQGRSSTTSAATSIETNLPSPRMAEGIFGYQKQTHSSLFSVADMQEELEPSLSWQQGQYGHHYHHHHPYGHHSQAHIRPSSSGTMYSEGPLGSHSHGHSHGMMSSATNRWPYQSHTSLRQTSSVRPTSSASSSGRPGSAGSTKSGTPSHHHYGPASGSNWQRTRRRPSFGLNIAPAAAAAFDSIPAPTSATSSTFSRSPQVKAVDSGVGKSELDSDYCSQSHAKAQPGPKHTFSDGHRNLSEKLSDAEVQHESPPEVLEPRLPLADAPMSPDLVMDGDTEFNFSLGGVSSPNTSGHNSLRKSSTTAAPEDEGPLELLADDQAELSSSEADNRSAADAEMAVNAPKGLAIHKTREREKGFCVPTSPGTPSRRSSYASFSKSVEDLTSLPPPSYGYL